MISKHWKNKNYFELFDLMNHAVYFVVKSIYFLIPFSNSIPPFDGYNIYVRY
jgi:hypothetical protein